MEAGARTGSHDLNLASRKAEEAAWRRFQAAEWLESLVGPLGISSQPSEKEFISCLRNGLILCNAINKIQSGAVPKVVENSSYVQSFSRESQPPPAYQYFENVRNFLVALEELKLPAFEASDLERDTMDAGSAAKVVDCILALKSFSEWKQMNCGNGFYKNARSPMVMNSASRPPRGPAFISSESCRRLDMSSALDKQLPANDENNKKLEDLVVKVLADNLLGAKENIDENLLASACNGSLDLFKLFGKILSISSEEELQNKFPEMKPNLKDYSKENRSSAYLMSSSPLEEISSTANSQCPQVVPRKGNCNQRNLLHMQEKELLDLKTLLSSTKKEFKNFESQLQRDLKELGRQVHDMSSAALGYHSVVQENRKLYNMVQDLKGNIRVYCRIRPAFSAEAKNVVEFIGDDGSLVIWDPSKPQKDGRKSFQFNRVFGPNATQDEVFKDTQPLIRSVMDGYNVCIFAYGQTGSGKTHTMSGPSGGLTKDMGINYLALEDLFQMSKGRKDIINYDIYVQMVEIYNEQVRDLLAEDSSTTKLEIRSCTSESGLNLPDATMHTVKSTTDVLNLMKLGEVNRVVSSTALNNRSSRSHSVLTVHVHGKDVSGNIIRSCLHLVDLAGSERVDKSEVTGDRLKEAQYINKSLSCLGDVIMALAQKNAHIPYRNSKLTLLLQDSLGGHAKTLMFAHVSPEENSFGETISTLKFAQRVSTVELGAARVNKESNEVMQLKEQIESLKKVLANKEAQKPLATIERTPPRTRRMSIENGSTTKTDKMKSSIDRKGIKTPTVPTRGRRLSLERPRYGMKENTLMNVSEDVISITPPLEATQIQKSVHFQDSEAISKIYDDSRPKAPRSPISSVSYQTRAIKTDGRTRVSTLQLPVTPEPRILARNEVHVMMQNDVTLSIGSSRSGKGSQLRKSLRTIGKLIHGSDKRSQLKEITTGISNIIDGKSPTLANGRAVRRQSLTGIQGSERLRQSSLGGKPIESGANESGTAKTPPPLHPSAKTTKRWL